MDFVFGKSVSVYDLKADENWMDFVEGKLINFFE